MQFIANIQKIFVIMVLLICGCSQPKAELEITKSRMQKDSIQEIPFLKDGELTVLMSNNMASYYIFKGEPRGFEYEMLRLFCKDNKLDLKVKVIKDFDFLLDSLVAGTGDLAAGNITVTKARKSRVDFSPELLRTRQVLVQRLPKNYRKLSRGQRKARMVKDALELDGKTVHVNGGSSFYERLQNFANENGLDLNLVSVASDLGTDELVNMVADGEIEYTVLDENVAKIHAAIHKNIDISVPLSLSQNIAWAIPKGHEKLYDLLESWMDERKNSTRYNMIYNKYFGSKSPLKVQKNYMAIKDGEISPYDDLIKKHAQYIDWDWLLLAALINKESRFNPHAESNFGASGLMQVLPTTAKKFGVEGMALFQPEENIMAGTRYLQYLDNFWLKRLTDTSQITYFVLASYNAGPGHVLDAMYLCEKYGLNSQLWHDNVEVMLRNKSQPKYYRDPVAKRGYCNGKQPVDYVDKIMKSYAFYKAFETQKSFIPAIAAR